MKQSIIHLAMVCVATALLVGNAAAESILCPVDMEADGNPYLRGDHLNRWTTTATDGYLGTGGIGDPVTLTWSLIDDGTEVCPWNGVIPGPSSLYELMNDLNDFPNEEVWKQIIADCFQDWENWTGIDFIEATYDDGAELCGGSSGEIDVRADIRIGARPLVSGGAVARPPNNGDVLLGMSFNWDHQENDYRNFRNIVTHEIGHAIGLWHAFPQDDTKLMEEILNDEFDGPQDDDIRFAQRYYGDRNENDDVAAESNPSSGANANDHVSLDSTQDEDWYSFALESGEEVKATLIPVGSEYELIQDKWNIQRVAIVGSYALGLQAFRDNDLGPAQYAMVTWDVSDVAKPTKVNILEYASQPWDIAVAGDLAVVSVGNEIHIYDVSDPADPLHQGSIGLFKPLVVAIDGDYVYAVNQANRLYSIDISDPSTPVIADNHYVAYGEGLAIAGGTAFVASGDRFSSFDVSDPSDIIFLDDLPVTDAVHVTVVGSSAFVSDGTAGLRVVDVSDPTVMAITNTFDTPGEATACQVSGNRAYIADWSLGLHVMELSTGTILKSVGTQSIGAMDLVLSGNYAFVAGGGGDVSAKKGRLEVMDIRYPSFFRSYVGSDAWIDSRRIQDLSFEVWDDAGTTLLATVSSADVGEIETLDWTELGEGNYLIRVLGNGFDQPQRYSLSVLIQSTTPSSGPSSSSPLTVEPKSSDPNLTVIRLRSPEAGNGAIQIFDVQGRLLHETAIHIGSGDERIETTWDGRDRSGVKVSSGMYFVRAKVGGWIETARIVRLR